MTEYIAHRVNQKAELKALDAAYGAELDLRDGPDGRIYLQHDPFIPGEDFEEYLKSYRHGTLILNVKSERIEHRALELAQKYGVERFFFLDSSFPMIWLLAGEGERRTALRYSEAEGLDTLRNMAGRVGWVWVDCFTRLPLDAGVWAELKGMGYRVCIVSPELQGQPEKLEAYARQLRGAGMVPDAICTKVYNIPKWQALLEG